MKKKKSGEEREKTETKCLVAVNLRGTVNIPRPVKETLANLKVRNRFNATLLKENETTLGMLNRAKEHLAWAEAEEALVEKLLESRTQVMNGNTLEGVLKSAKAKNLSGLAKSITDGKVDFRKLKDVRPYFRLHPPRGGFSRSTRRLYDQGGVLGNNPELMNLIEKMLN
jgi:large subunit ribosomal protein L30